MSRGGENCGEIAKRQNEDIEALTEKDFPRFIRAF